MYMVLFSHLTHTFHLFFLKLPLGCTDPVAISGDMLSDISDILVCQLTKVIGKMFTLEKISVSIYLSHFIPNSCRIGFFTEIVLVISFCYVCIKLHII